MTFVDQMMVYIENALSAADARKWPEADRQILMANSYWKSCSDALTAMRETLDRAKTRIEEKKDQSVAPS